VSDKPVSSAQGFFSLMAAREQLRLRKESGEAWPWSGDDILNTFKFTNVKREHDRTTRWMRANWTGPNTDRPAGEIIFNCALFRYFGTREFAAAIGWQTAWDPNRCIRLASERRARGERVFTGAYIVPTLGHRGPKAEAVCNLILSPLWDCRNRIAEVARETQRWETVATEMRELPGFGGTGFMTKEVLQDVMQTPVLANALDRNTWCPAGPGARRGLNRIHNRELKRAVGEAQLLKEMIALLEAAAGSLPAFMPELELHDIQFQLCEYDKYERVRLGQGRPKARYEPPRALTMRVTAPSGSI
jgi:alpha-glutamyl/putrescinyl thymine pyrophosphorylase clade 1